VFVQISLLLWNIFSQTYQFSFFKLWCNEHFSVDSRIYFHKFLVTTVFLLFTFRAHIHVPKILIASFIKAFLFLYALWQWQLEGGNFYLFIQFVQNTHPLTFLVIFDYKDVYREKLVGHKPFGKHSRLLTVVTAPTRQFFSKCKGNAHYVCKLTTSLELFKVVWKLDSLYITCRWSVFPNTLQKNDIIIHMNYRCWCWQNSKHILHLCHLCPASRT
jgi:hypothetical protein